VVHIEDFAGVGDIQVVIRALAPGQADQPVQVGADDAVFGGGGGQLGHAVQLAAGLLLRLLGHPGFLDLPAELLDLDLLLIGLAQFMLDGLELLAQEVLALDLLHLRLGLRLDLAAQLQNFQLLVEDGHQPAELGRDVVDLQELLAFLQVDPDVGCDGVDDLQRIVHVQGGGDQLRRDAGHQLRQVGKLVDDVAGQGLDLDVVLDLLRVAADPGDQVWLGGRIFLDLDAGQALHQQADGAIRGAEQAVNHGHRAHAVDLVRAGLFVLRIAGGDQADQALLAGHIIDQADRARLADGQRDGRIGVHDHAAQGQDGQRLRQAQLVGRFLRLFFRFDVDGLLVAANALGRWGDNLFIRS